MKKILLSTVALVGFSAGAMAADLPRRAAPPAFVAAPVFTWTGFYVGVNVGYGWRNNDDNNSIFFPAGSITGSAATTGNLTLFDNNDEDGGILGGAQIGYNVQFGSFVFGIEGDIQAADLSGDRRNSVGGTYTFVGTPGLAFAPPPATVVRSGSGIDWFGTVRARAGFAFDRALIYATGGFAFGGGDSNNNGGGCGAFAGGVVGCDDDDWRGGYAVGGGIEYAFTNNLTVKLEGLYVNLERDNNNGGAVFNAATNTLFLGSSEDDDFGLVRVGLNYKF
jgi:outer membrane immunogenic protein